MNKFVFRIAIALHIIATCRVLFADETVSVMRVLDGRTFLTREGDRVVLAWIDVPKRTELGGGDAALILHKLIKGESVTLKNVKREWGTVTARVMFDDGKYDAAMTMLDRGYAWIHSPAGIRAGFVAAGISSSVLMEKYRTSVARAKSQGSGIWSARFNTQIQDWRGGTPQVQVDTTTGTMLVPASPVPVFQ